MKSNAKIGSWALDIDLASIVVNGCVQAIAARVGRGVLTRLMRLSAHSVKQFNSQAKE
jgi:hypothetical protein